MKNKFLFTLALFAGITGSTMAGTTPKKTPGNHNPGTDSATAAKGTGTKSTPTSGQQKNPVVTTATTTPTVTPAAPKTKIVVQSKKEGTYELKAPSIFTFTVLNTYLNMPIQKK